MEEKIEHHPGHFEHIESCSISEREAINRTIEWREFIKKNIPDESNEQMIPRAVYISMDDIAALYNKYKDRAKGVRAYFTKKDQPCEYPIDELPGDPEHHHKHHHKKRPEISVVLVPVNYFDKDMITPELTLAAGHSNVYDFTKPCPDLCDVSSPLYSYE